MILYLTSTPPQAAKSSITSVKLATFFIFNLGLLRTGIRLVSHRSLLTDLLICRARRRVPFDFWVRSICNARKNGAVPNLGLLCSRVFPDPQKPNVITADRRLGIAWSTRPQFSYFDFLH